MTSLPDPIYSISSEELDHGATWTHDTVWEEAGKIEGSCDMKGREGSIWVQQFDHEICLPTEILEGDLVGQLMHKELKIHKHFDKSSPKLFNALVNDEEFERIVFKWYRININGAEEHYFTHTLEDATIVSIKPYMHNALDPEKSQYGHMEEIAFTYRKIDWTWVDGGVAASDERRDLIPAPHRLFKDEVRPVRTVHIISDTDSTDELKTLLKAQLPEHVNVSVRKEGGLTVSSSDVIALTLALTLLLPALIVLLRRTGCQRRIRIRTKEGNEIDVSDDITPQRLRQLLDACRQIESIHIIDGLPLPLPCPVRAFVSHSTQDRLHCEELCRHLSVLQHQGLQVCHEGILLPGAAVKEEICRQIREAELILLLLSSDYLADREQELVQAIERHKNGALVVPVLLRAVGQVGTLMCQLRMLPSSGMPVTSWPNRDEAWGSVCEDIRRSIVSWHSGAPHADIGPPVHGKAVPAALWWRRFLSGLFVRADSS